MDELKRKVAAVEGSLECARLSQAALAAIVLLADKARAAEDAMMTSKSELKRITIMKGGTCEGAATPPPRSWRPEVIADASGECTPNGLRFHTEVAARAWARDLADRWTLVRDFRASPSDDEPNQNDEVLAADRESWRIA